ncbi:MAG: 2-C-methyl-D-erythritol 2,4-cyclodiphosphate synthase [Ignavibacteria bacterium]|nr:2-C-methyl-D-erythritol 2,4-cyclodiphosphate synthase [Ignavibacteria bacterium]
MNNKEFRTGIGYDVHRFASGRKLILGGVEIPHKLGLTGHSDADVLLHAICDSLLGAAGYADIGNQFPNTDDKYKNISSLILLSETYKLLSDSNWKISNVDSIVILEEPKISSFIPQMKKKISDILHTDNISVKATTSEGMGFIGNKEGCAAYSTALIFR